MGINLFKIKGKQFICFSKESLLALFNISKKSELVEIIKNTNIPFSQLITKLSNKTSSDRDEHEIFVALFILIDFYEEGTEICFEMRNDFNPNKDKINIIRDLNKFRDNGTDTDFIFKSKNDLRFFQLKRYRGNLNTESLFDFIKNKIKHYGDLGTINLLILLQSIDDGSPNFDFHVLHERIKLLNLKFGGEILILFNNANKINTIINIYPDLTNIEVPMQLPSSKFYKYN